MGVTIFDPLACLVRLDGAGREASPLPRSPEAWRALNRATGERVIGMSAPVSPGDLHPENWEMHPHGDEVLLLLEGALDLELEGDAPRALQAGQACVVESGTWHRLLLRAPARLLFVTPAGGTRMRPHGHG